MLGRSGERASAQVKTRQMPSIIVDIQILDAIIPWLDSFRFYFLLKFHVLILHFCGAHLCDKRYVSVASLFEAKILTTRMRCLPAMLSGARDLDIFRSSPQTTTPRASQIPSFTTNAGHIPIISFFTRFCPNFHRCYWFGSIFLSINPGKKCNCPGNFVGSARN